jgi:hypothetical protein
MQDECVAALKQGEVLGIAPGGSRESLYTQVQSNKDNGKEILYVVFVVSF